MTATEEQARMIANRCSKRLKHLRKRFERDDIGAFRLYDRDIPEIRAAVDWYEGHLVFAEYTRAQTDAIAGWADTMAHAIATSLAVPEDRVHVKQRQTGRGVRYEKLSSRGERVAVREFGLKFWVNLDDYIDTGLFLDHRLTRRMVGQACADRRFLNLFAYTGAFTCHAAVGGAKATTTVDRSNTYLDWAENNLDLNDLSGPHEMIRADVHEFLQQARKERRRWDIAVLDPPSFSTGGLDVQNDHRDLIDQTLAVLRAQGELWFSTNHQRFEPYLDGLDAVEMTSQTVPEDFRNRQPHRCWRITKS